ncbi:MAG: methyltransferase domain-containing protein [Chloroflexi bacterium]|nr:MAG: methyltransferase domain-containing protein [Chloroflexota bacterium]
MQAPTEWWRTWFGPGYLALYDDHLAERTSTEIDQLEALLRLRPPARVLDLPCGQGRHSIELARRGYSVTGVDLSGYMLAVARERAEARGVDIRFLEGDMREPLAGERFDLVLNLFTSFGYFADEPDDRRVATAAATMLDPGGRLLIELINGERVMKNFQEREWFTVGDAAVMERRWLDRGSRRMTVERTVDRNGGDATSVHVVRLYGRQELVALLATAGFAQVRLFGDWDGSPATADALRIIAVASS